MAKKDKAAAASPASGLKAWRDSRAWALGGSKVHIVAPDGRLLCKKTYPGTPAEEITSEWLAKNTGEPDVCSICCKRAKPLIK